MDEDPYQQAYRALADLEEATSKIHVGTDRRIGLNQIIEADTHIIRRTIKRFQDAYSPDANK